MTTPQKTALGSDPYRMTMLIFAVIAFMYFTGEVLKPLAQSVHWHAAWVHAFEAIGDSESARELSAVLAEEQAHRDALQQGLNRVAEQHARGADEIESGPTPSQAAR